MTADLRETCGPAVLTFRLQGLRGTRVECRKLTQAPKNGTIGFLYRRSGDNLNQRGVCFYQDDQWQDGSKKPIKDQDECLWAALVSE